MESYNWILFFNWIYIFTRPESYMNVDINFTSLVSPLMCFFFIFNLFLLVVGVVFPVILIFISYFSAA